MRGDQDACPNFFVVGAAKAGTTSLYRCLSQHPDVYMAPVKEPHWFSRVQPNPEHAVSPVTSEREYLKLFEGWKGESAIGEASPSYLWDAEAPHRIKDALPHAKIIAILRHPVERAYSHYLMNVQEGIQNLPFLEALEEDHQARRKGWGVSHLYVDLGLYAEQVRRYLEAFDRSQVKVILYEDVRGDPKTVLESLFGFLEVDPQCAEGIYTDVHYNPYTVPRNHLTKTVLRSRRIRSLGAKVTPKPTREWIRKRLLSKREPKPAMDEGAREFLMDLFRPDIRKLQKSLGRDLDSWLR